MSCNEEGTAYSVHTFDGEKDIKFNCDAKGKAHENKFSYARMICEDPKIICSKATTCPNDCYYDR